MPPDLSKNNTLYRNKTERHPDLDNNNITTSVLQERGIQMATGSWTNYEMYLLFLNIRTAKENFGIASFKKFFLQDDQDKDQFNNVMDILTQNILRTRKLIKAKVKNIYQTARIDQKQSRLYTENEVELLQKYHKEYAGDWEKISAVMKRPAGGLKAKFHEIDNAKKCVPKTPTTPKQFTEAEDKKLLEIVDKMIIDGSDSSKKRHIPWKLVAEKLDTGRRPSSLITRYNLLKSNTPKFTRPEVTKLMYDTVKLLIHLKVDDVADVDWEKVRGILDYEGSAVQLKISFQGFMKKRFNQKRGTAHITKLRERFTYLMDNF